MKKTLIFDNEWVLVRNDWDNVAKLFSERFSTPLLDGKKFKKSLQVKKDGINILQAYSRGDVDSYQFWETVFDSYQIDYNKERAEEASDIFSKLTTYESNERLLNFIKDNKALYNVFMLSNSTSDIERGNRERHNYFDLFDDIFYSHHLGMRKPESRIYEHVLKKHNLDPKTCYFIDDKPENVEAAKNVGMNGILYSMDDSLETILKEIEY